MTKLKFGVVVFPGSNCDHDALTALENQFGQDARPLWHKDSSVGDCDVVILPGGFSYGDYLRCGAIARVSPIMKDVVSFAARGGVVIGICNGFQILCESGLLPGALLRNASLSFVCKDVHLRVEQTSSMFTAGCTAGEVLTIPIAPNPIPESSEPRASDLRCDQCDIPMFSGTSNRIINAVLIVNNSP